MKKRLIAALLILLALLIAVGVFLIVRFLSLYGGMQKEAAQESTRSADVEAYVKEHWPGYEASYDDTTRTLTLSKETQLDYDAACAYGGSVYTDSLAPETFRHDAASIALDVSAHCDVPTLSVTLCYLSADGTPIFTVSSSGDVWTCWS